MNPIDHIYNQLCKITSQESGFNIKEIQEISFLLITDPAKEQFGDISTNIALILSKKIGSTPKELAQKLLDKLNSSSSSEFRELISKSEIAGPGFINIFLSDKALNILAHELFEKESDFFRAQDANILKNRFNLEFVSANPTGPLHIGHGRGAIIGDVLGNILRFTQNTADKEFYINDAGNQITILGESLKIRCLQTLASNNNQDSENLELPEKGYQGAYLIELAEQCLKELGENITDKPVSFFSEYAKKHLLAQIKQTLELYNIKYDTWFSEKSLHDSGAIEKAISKLESKGYLYELDGATWFKSTEFGDDKDRVLKKKSGELTYVAADIAYLENKLARGFNKLIMVLGQDHHSYVQRLKGIMSALGHDNKNLDIILYQLVTLKDKGEQLRMSKRKGRSVTLQDVIDTVGTDVARFFYLNRKADAHLDFDIDLALKKTDENPVYYIQYAYVRTNSILNKSQEISELRDINHSDSIYVGQDEKILLKKIGSLRELINNISGNYQTHLLTYYVLELSQLFHRYYNSNKVINPDDINTSRGRLLIIILVRSTLKLCFELMGISAPEKM